MKLKEKDKERIQNAIKLLHLTNDELDSITTGNMDRICKLANVNLLALMWYLRYERGEK